MMKLAMLVCACAAMVMAAPSDKLKKIERDALDSLLYLQMLKGVSI